MTFNARLDRAEADRQNVVPLRPTALAGRHVSGSDSFDPHIPSTWPDDLSAFLKSNVPSTAEIVEAYSSWRECHAEIERDALLRSIEAKLSATTAPAASSGETVEQYAKRWLDHRNGDRNDTSRMRDHVVPLIAGLDVATFTRDDVENVRDALDAKIVSGALAWKTSRSAWTLLTSMCKDMVRAKRRDLRVRRDNPAADVEAPERGARKAKQYLYPSEFLTFVRCETVPLRWRRLVAVAVYTYVRDGELRALDWDAVDLEHRTIHVHAAWDRQHQCVASTKTETTRRIPVQEHLLPLLRVMHDESHGDGRVIDLPSERTMARGLRRWLRHAGVTRDELFEATPTRKPMTFHDLRATGATWAAVAGVDALKIQQRLGHSTLDMTLVYVREAEALRDGFGTPFPALPASLLGDPKPPSGGRGGSGGGVSRRSSPVRPAEMMLNPRSGI